MAAPLWLTLPWSEVSGRTFLLSLLAFAASTPGSATALGEPCLALSHQAALVFLLKAFDKNMRGVRCKAQHPAACCLKQVSNAGVRLPPPLTLSFFCSGRILLDTCVPVHHGLMASYCLSAPRSGQRTLYSLPGLYTCWAFSRLKTTCCGHQV